LQIATPLHYDVRAAGGEREVLLVERRAYPRAKGPFDGYWDGAGTQSGRVLDLSVTGCFIESLTPPLIGQVVTVSISITGAQIIVPAKVQYRDSQQGFGVRFLDVSEQVTSLLRHEVQSKLTQ
jgi:PilZ domain